MFGVFISTPLQRGFGGVGSGATGRSVFISTPLQRGVNAMPELPSRFNGFSLLTMSPLSWRDDKAVETVSDQPGIPTTALKRGANEK